MAEYIDRETLLEEIEQQKRASKSNYTTIGGTLWGNIEAREKR